MIITVLTENMAGGYLQAEHGLSYLIEIKGDKILFDTGHTDVFLKNAKKLGIDIQQETDTVVLSHGHWDHGNGLQYLKNKKLICHPGAFKKRYRKNKSGNLGLALTREQLERKFIVHATRDAYKIRDDLYFLGEIPRGNNFEAKTTSFILESGEEDFVKDDSALVAIQEEQLIIITGCSHSGICNIIEYAVKLTGITRIKAVIGGFHLKHVDQQTKKTIDYFMKRGINHVYPSHCTELPALSAFYNAFGNTQVKTGMKMTM